VVEAMRKVQQQKPLRKGRHTSVFSVKSVQIGRKRVTSKLLTT
jgi:hypothetical protein